MIRGHRVTDIHVHVQPWEQLTKAAWETMAEPRRDKDLDTLLALQKDPAVLITELDRLGLDRIALINYAAPTTLGFDENVNDWVARYCEHDPERLIACGGIDIHGAATTTHVTETIETMAADGIRLVKLHPAHQIVWPNAYRPDSPGHRGHPPSDRPYGDTLSALYDACSDHGLPLMVHTGTSIFPGARNTMTDPLLLDDVAIDHPKLHIILAHAGRPLWGPQAIFVARRHRNVHLDLSGIPPQHIREAVPALPKVAHKCLWGTDWPGPGLPPDAMRTNVEAFLDTDLGISDEDKAAILHHNADRLLGT